VIAIFGGGKDTGQLERDGNY